MLVGLIILFDFTNLIFIIFDGILNVNKNRAFASTEVLESYVGLNTGTLPILSTEQVAMCTPNPLQVSHSSLNQ